MFWKISLPENFQETHRKTPAANIYNAQKMKFSIRSVKVANSHFPARSVTFNEEIFKGVLRPKFHSRFYGIFMLILWRKSLVQSFVVFRSVFTKLWVSKFWIRCMWRHTRKCTKHLTLVFFTYLYWFYAEGTFAKFHGVLNVRKFWMIVSPNTTDVINANEHT